MKSYKSVLGLWFVQWNARREKKKTEAFIYDWFVDFIDNNKNEAHIIIREIIEQVECLSFLEK